MIKRLLLKYGEQAFNVIALILWGFLFADSDKPANIIALAWIGFTLVIATIYRQRMY